VKQCLLDSPTEAVPDIATTLVVGRKGLFAEIQP